MFGRARGAEAERGEQHDGEVAPGIGPEVDPHHRGHPAQVEREEEDEHRPLPEYRHREAEEGAHAGDVVHRLVAADRGDDAGGPAQQEREHHREHGQLQGDRQPLQDERDHRLAGPPRGAEVPLHEPAQPAPVLQVPRLVEPEEPLQLGHHRRAGDGVRADHLLDHRARDQPQHQEHQHRQAQQCEGHRVQANDQVSRHARWRARIVRAQCGNERARPDECGGGVWGRSGAAPPQIRTSILGFIQPGPVEAVEERRGMLLEALDARLGEVDGLGREEPEVRDISRIWICTRS